MQLNGLQFMVFGDIVMRGRYQLLRTRSATGSEALTIPASSQTKLKAILAIGFSEKTVINDQPSVASTQ
jgi:hypothetical protein